MGVQKAPALVPGWKEKALFRFHSAHQHGPLSQMPPASSFPHRVKIANALDNLKKVSSPRRRIPTPALTHDACVLHA